jgi:uncharacterized protein (DUF2236 family)
MGRHDRLRYIQSLDPETEYEQIYRLVSQYEFPWDVARALELALYRTYAVPSIGALLDSTAEFGTRAQKRYDDTALLLGEVAENGLESPRGREAIRRINRIHGRFAISNDDFLYVLATFVLVPTRWLDRYGWRPLSERERTATHRYYRELGRRMGIRDVPASYEAMSRFADAYERRHFRFSPASRRTALATRELFVSWFPRPLAPLSRTAATALLDPALLRAFGFRPAARWVYRTVDLGLRGRARVERHLPPRTRPVRARDHRTVKGYRDGYSIDRLGSGPERTGLPPPGTDGGGGLR